MKIVVLAGGLSPERNVSLSSGTMIAEALRGADAGEMRCEKCFYSLGGHDSRGLRCFCPKMAVQFVEKDFFCGHFEKRGQQK